MSFRTILDCCPLSKLACLAAVLVALAACQQHPKSAPAAPSPTDFNALLQKGDYAGALAFLDKASLPAAEKDGVAGTLILDGLVDPKATTKPPFPLSEGFKRLERAAAAGRGQSASDLKAKFTTGINYEGKNSLMPPNPELATCWGAVEKGSEKAPACIELRQSLKTP